MNLIESLISEYNELNFIFKNDMPYGLNGLINKKDVYLNNKLPFNQLYATLAEEIGHHETACVDIVDQTNISKRKHELRGRQWSYRKLVPYEKLKKYIENNEAVHRYELAEVFGVPDNIIDEAVNLYRIEGYI